MCLATFIRTSTFHRTDESSFTIRDNTSMQHNTHTVTKILTLKNLNVYASSLCIFHISSTNYYTICVARCIYTPQGRVCTRSIDKRQESNKVLLWSIWLTRRREYLQRQSPRLSNPPRQSRVLFLVQLHADTAFNSYTCVKFQCKNFWKGN